MTAAHQDIWKIDGGWNLELVRQRKPTLRREERLTPGVREDDGILCKRRRACEGPVHGYQD